MASGDADNLIEAVVTCEGNLHDPDFSERFQILLGNLKSLLREDELVKVKKIEPWNSVRVTISIPKEAAQKLKLLAQQGSHVLKSLGILTVQVEGDQVISLTLAGHNNEATEVVLRQNEGSTSSSAAGGILPLQSSLPIAPTGFNVPLAILSPSPSSSAFRSPNVVAPVGESIPVLPPKSSSILPRPPSLGGPFPFASMAHAAQTMQRTDPATQSSANGTTNSSSPLNSNNVNNNHAVNSTNFPNVPSPASAPPVTPLPPQPSSSSSVSAANINLSSVVLTNSSSVSSPSVLLTQSQQQQGVFKSEQLGRFMLQQQVHQQGGSSGTVGTGLPNHANPSPQSQSLQLHIVNAPPPYPGVNSSSDSSSNPSGISNSVNHHHHQQQLNSANNSNTNNTLNNVAGTSQSVTFVGAPPSSSVSSVSSTANATLARSVSSPSMSSQPLVISDSLLASQQQPMSSPLLVNLLQNNDALSPSQNQSASIQPGQGQGIVNIMLPPGTLEQQKRFILHQQVQQRKAKRGLSLDGASLSLGETGSTGSTGIPITATELARPSSAGVADRASPALSSAVAVGSSQIDNNTLTQITLPSSDSRITMGVPISVGQPRLSQDLSTTATIIQGRTIIHQGNVRVFNPGQIRAIRLTQANTSSPSTIHFIQGKPGMTMTTSHGESIGSPVIMNGPHPVMSTNINTNATTLSPSAHQHVLISSTISNSSGSIITNSSSSQFHQHQGMKQEPNVVYSADQSSRTFDNTNMNPPPPSIVSTSFSSSSRELMYGSSSSSNYSISNTFIPPSEPLSTSSSLSTSLATLHNHPRLSTITTSSPLTHQERQNAVQSHEAKLFPSQHQHHRGLTPKQSKDSLPHPPQLTSSGKPRQLLINPLTGHLEPMPSESSSDSDEGEENKSKGKTILEKSRKGLAHMRGGSIQHRQIVTTTTTGVTVARVVKTASIDSQKELHETLLSKKHQLQLQQQNRLMGPVTISSVSSPTPASVGAMSRKSREEGVVTITSKEKDSTSLKSGSNPSGEKIKLRLKLEKNEPISPAYKVDVSFVKKSEKSSISSPSGALTSASSPVPPVGSPGEQQPRVPPLHISLRGKNSAVVVSSPRRDEDNNSLSPINFMDVKPTSLSKSGKRKTRVKSNGGESDPEGNKFSKNPSKLSRPRLSKDSCIVNDVGATSQENLLKDRLDSSGSVPATSAPIGKPSVPMSMSVSVKDLISSGSSVTTIASSSIPAPTVKLKKSRRTSESEVVDSYNPHHPFPLMMKELGLTKPLGKSPAKPQPPPLESSSLLFQHLSKKDDSPLIQPPLSPLTMGVTVSQTVSTLAASVTPVSFPTPDAQGSQILSSASTTSVLTLTSTATGATISTLAQGIPVTEVGSVGTNSPPLSTSPSVSKAAEVGGFISKNTNTLTATVGPTNIPKLNRENIPNELDLTGAKGSIPDTRKSVTPTSKSPKPLPDLLALPNTSSVDTKVQSLLPPSPIHKDTTTGVSPGSSVPPSPTKLSFIQQTTPDISDGGSSSFNEPLSNAQPQVPSPMPKIPFVSDGAMKIVPHTTSPVSQKADKSHTPSVGSPGSVKTKASPPTPVLRPKVQAPRVSIGTSIDSDLPSLTPSPSLRELLEKEKERNVSKEKDGVMKARNAIDINKPVGFRTEVPKSVISEVKQCVKVNHINRTVSQAFDKTLELQAPTVTPISKPVGDPKDPLENLEDEKVQSQLICEPVLMSETCEMEVKINPDEPLPSTVIPNAPLPFPLVLPKPDDQTGATGEDSGIDSMDALSEKSPNQGESPARKEIEQFGDSNNHLSHCGPVYTSPRVDSDAKGGISNVDVPDDSSSTSKLPMPAPGVESGSKEESAEVAMVIPEECVPTVETDANQSTQDIQKLTAVPSLPSINLEILNSVGFEESIPSNSVDKLEPAHIEEITPEQLPLSDGQGEPKEFDDKNLQGQGIVPVIPASDKMEVDSDKTEVVAVDIDTSKILDVIQHVQTLVEPEPVAPKLSSPSSSNVQKLSKPSSEPESKINPETMDNKAVTTESSEIQPASVSPKVQSSDDKSLLPPTEKESIAVGQNELDLDTSQFDLKVQKENMDREPLVPDQLLTNHVDTIQEQENTVTQPKQKVVTKDIAKVRRAKLENIVAAIGTKNIERQQQAKSEWWQPTSAPITPDMAGNLEPLSLTSKSNPVPTELENKPIVRVIEAIPPKSSATDTTSEEQVDLEQNSEIGRKIPGNILDTEFKQRAVPEPTVQGKPSVSECLPNSPELVHIHQVPDGLIASEAHKKENKPTVPDATSKTSTTLLQEKVMSNAIPPVTEEKMVLASKSLPTPVFESEKINLVKTEELESKNEMSRVNDTENRFSETDHPISEVKVNIQPEPAISVVSHPTDLSQMSKPQIDSSVSIPSKVSSPELPTFQPSGQTPTSVVPPTRAPSPQKPSLEPQLVTPTPKLKPKAKVKVETSSPAGRRIQDKPPKLSKATETDPRPETANPPRLEMGNLDERLKQVEVQGNVSSATKIQVQNVVPNPQQIQQQSPLANVSLPGANMIQLSKAAFTQAAISKIPIAATVTASQQGMSASMGSIAVPLQTNATSTALGGNAQTVFAIHPNMSLPANLTHLQSHGQSAITVLPGGQKIVPVKLVTIPRQTSAPFQTIPLTGIGHNRSSPNLLEAVNIVANAGSRSNSPKTIVGNPLQTTGPINLSSVSLAAGGNIHLVPISMSSTVGGTSSPMKVLVSQPIKMPQALHQPMVVKSVVMGQGQQATTIRVVRPAEPVQNNPTIPIQAEQTRVSPVVIVQEKPGVMSTTPVKKGAETLSVPVPTSVTSKLKAPDTLKSTPTATQAQKPVPTSTQPVQSDPPKSIFKHVDGLEVLDAGLSQMNDDDLPFEADIIHDEKDLEDVLAGESIEVQENGIDNLNSPYDFSIDEKNDKYLGNYASGIRKQHENTSFMKTKTANSYTNSKIRKPSEHEEPNSLPESPIPVIRSSSPLFTYGNRSSRTSRPSTRSPSPAESDVHGEDQEIIDSFTRSPSQPKLSPQNQTPRDNADEYDTASPRKPDLLANRDENELLNRELSIEIPPVDLMVLSPSQSQQQHQVEERKSTRSTRSNTRLVSPDITAFRSDTPKPSKFSSKPDPLILKNSPKPSPTGSLKILSPTVSGLTITPSSSNRSSPISLGQTAAINANHATSVTSGAIDKIMGNSTGMSNSPKNSKASKRKRQESDSSSASKDENSEEKPEIDLNARPGKRRCSENAAELIKACIGVEDTPKRNSMLIKRMEESKLKEAKLKKAMATLAEENEDDNESVESVLSRGRSRSSRASSEDRSSERGSSRGSSVQRNITSSKVSKDEDHSKDQKSKSNIRAGKDKQKTGQDDSNQNAKKDGVKGGTPGKRVIRGIVEKEKSPLTPAKTRTNVRKDVTKSDKSSAVTNSTNPPETENLRRKTRSTAAGRRHVEASDDLAALKRRRMSKETKS